MLRITSNIGQVTGVLISRLQSLSTAEMQDKLTRTVATTIVPELRYRIHVEGKDSEGNPFGKYNNSYLRLRQRKYNRTSDDNIVLSLTRQMENDLSVVANRSKTGYGIGFKNSINGEKVSWLQKRYGRYYKLDPTQIQILRDTTEQFIKDLNNNAIS